MLRLGVWATAETFIGRLALVLAVVAFSLEIAVMVRAVVPCQFRPGIKTRLLSWFGVSVHDPSGFCVPADNTAPGKSANHHAECFRAVIIDKGCGDR